VLVDLGDPEQAGAAVNAIRPMRVSKEAELEGLDVPEFGMVAYPEESLATFSTGAEGA
jgi:hypothetical protein